LNLGERLSDPTRIIPPKDPDDEGAELKLRTSTRLRDTVEFIRQWEAKRGNEYSQNEIHEFLVKWSADTHVEREGLGTELEKFLAKKKEERLAERKRKK
jgi:hypothetical protein